MKMQQSRVAQVSKPAVPPTSTRQDEWKGRVRSPSAPVSATRLLGLDLRRRVWERLRRARRVALSLLVQGEESIRLNSTRKGPSFCTVSAPFLHHFSAFSKNPRSLSTTYKKNCTMAKDGNNRSKPRC